MRAIRARGLEGNTRKRFDPSAASSDRPDLALAAELVARGKAWVRGSGDSMAPTICDGDRVLIRAVRQDLLRPGDVVAIAVPRAAVLHRIHRIFADGSIETVGDARLGGDGVIPRQNVLGVAVLAERSRGRVALRSTLEFGIGPYLWGIAFLARLRVAQRLRNWRTRFDWGATSQ